MITKAERHIDATDCTLLRELNARIYHGTKRIEQELLRPVQRKMAELMKERENA